MNSMFGHMQNQQEERMNRMRENLPQIDNLREQANWGSQPSHQQHQPAYQNMAPQPHHLEHGLAETFRWDPQSKCFYDEGSGFYYDIERRLYYHDGQYYDWNDRAQSYVVVPDP